MVLMVLWTLRLFRVLRGLRSRARLRLRSRLRRRGSRLLSLLWLTALLNWRGLARRRRRFASRRRLTNGRGLANRRSLTHWRGFTQLTFGGIHALLRGHGFSRESIAIWRCGPRVSTRRKPAPVWRSLAIRRCLSIRRPLRGMRRAQARLRCVVRRYPIRQIPRPRSRGNRRAALIGGGAQFRVRARGLFMPALRRGDLNVTIARRGQFPRRWLGTYAVAAVETHAVDGDIVDDSFIVDVGDVHRAYVDDGAIVEDVTVPPIAALVASAAVAVAVIDATIESDGRTPIADMPKIHTCPEGPVSRCPQIIRLRCLDPCARHPVVILDVVTPSPIARSPQIPVSGNRRLVIDR